MSVKRMLTVGMLVVLLCSVSTSVSYAYLDPGTGSYVFQLLIAGLLGLLFLLKVYWNRVKSFVVGVFSEGSDADAKEREEQDV